VHQRGFYIIPTDEFVQKSVIFGLSPDEKTMQDVLALCASHQTKCFTEQPPSKVDLPLLKSVFLKQSGQKFVKLMIQLLKSLIEDFYKSKVQEREAICPP
jgi:hypothetical protein